MGRLTAILALLLCVGCTTTKYIPAESTSVRTDTLHHYTHSRDCVWLHDSVYVAMQGDTVRIEKWRTRYQYKYITDTLWRVRADSVRVQVPYPVERDLTRWEQTKMDVGGVAIGALLLAIAIAVMWLIKRFRK